MVISRCLKYILVLVVFISCKTSPSNIKTGFTRNGLTSVRISKTGRPGAYKMKVPNNQPITYQIITFNGGEKGEGFAIEYSDGAVICYKNNYPAFATPNWESYEKTFDVYPFWRELTDTVVSGVLPNGKYWKEIIAGEERLGYRNVDPELVHYFDTSLGSLQTSWRDKEKQ